MLVTLALNAGVFDSSSVRTTEERIGAERVLEAMLHNAVLVTAQADLSSAMCGMVTDLTIRLGQRLTILATEVQKEHRNIIRAIRCRPDDPRREPELILAARRGRADLIVCSAHEIDELQAAIGSNGPPVCTIADYPTCDVEQRRVSWLVSQELSRMDRGQSAELLKRAVAGTDRIVIVDKMFGRAAKDGNVSQQLRRFARGVVYLAERWHEAALHEVGAKPVVEIVTVGGGTGAAAGYVNPLIARPAIEGAIAAEDRSGAVGAVRTLFKSDSDPPIFRDRFIAVGSRCWGIRHGMDDIGKLYDRPSRRSPTFLDPDCTGHRYVVGQILRLPDVQ